MTKTQTRAQAQKVCSQSLRKRQNAQGHKPTRKPSVNIKLRNAEKPRNAQGDKLQKPSPNRKPQNSQSKRRDTQGGKLQEAPPSKHPPDPEHLLCNIAKAAGIQQPLELSRDIFKTGKDRWVFRPGAEEDMFQWKVNSQHSFRRGRR